MDTTIVTFCNHPPIRISGADWANRETAWSSGQDFGHHDLDFYRTKRGKKIYWISYNSGCSYNGRDPKTTRTYMRDIAAIKAYFYEAESKAKYHAEVEARIDPASIIDVDLIA